MIERDDKVPTFEFGREDGHEIDRDLGVVAAWRPLYRFSWTVDGRDGGAGVIPSDRRGEDCTGEEGQDRCDRYGVEVSHGVSMVMIILLSPSVGSSYLMRRLRMTAVLIPFTTLGKRDPAHDCPTQLDGSSTV